MTNIAEKSILIVDDTESSVDMLVAALEDHYDVAVVLDGESALEIAADSTPDLILLDIVMPGMDGFEVFEKLSANPVTCRIPVVFLSGQAGEADQERANELGAAGFIAKPFDIPDVQRKVAQLLSHHSAGGKEDPYG